MVLFYLNWFVCLREIAGKWSSFGELPEDTSWRSKSNWIFSGNNSSDFSQFWVKLYYLTFVTVFCQSHTISLLQTLPTALLKRESDAIKKFKTGKCVNQPVGISMFGKMPIIACFLNLPKFQEYTGHCFRRSYASLLLIFFSH